MRIVWKSLAMVGALALTCQAEEPNRVFTWNPLSIKISCFSGAIGLLDSERDEYASTLTTLANNQVVTAKAAPVALAAARRMIGLALQLSPRNRKAMVTNFQLEKGILPNLVETEYSAQGFARLILTRGQSLEKQGGEENQKLARYMIQIAADLDPKNEDAVYLSELQRLDHGTLDWNAITDPAANLASP
jgi:hypothetical protein